MEPSLFLDKSGKDLYLLVYVDDLLLVGESTDVGQVKEALAQKKQVSSSA